MSDRARAAGRQARQDCTTVSRSRVELGVVKAEAAGGGTAAAASGVHRDARSGQSDVQADRGRAPTASRAVEKACGALAPRQSSTARATATPSVSRPRVDCVARAARCARRRDGGRRVQRDQAGATGGPALACQVAVAKAGRRFADRLHAALVKCLERRADRDATRAKARQRQSWRAPRKLDLGEPKARASSDRAAALASILDESARDERPPRSAAPCDPARRRPRPPRSASSPPTSPTSAKMVAAELNDACVMLTRARARVSALPAVCSRRELVARGREQSPGLSRSAAKRHVASSSGSLRSASAALGPRAARERRVRSS